MKMAYEKGSRPEGGFKKRGPARRRKKVCVFCGSTFLKEEKFFLEELQETVQNIREPLQ